MAEALTLEVLKTHLHYDPKTGVFIWRRPTKLGIRAGDVAGYVPPSDAEKRRVVIGLHNQEYRAGRLAWFYMTGAWPIGVVDHQDGDYTNHRWENLRDVTNQLNVQNQTRAARSNKSSGRLGVTWDKRRAKWKAQIKLDRKNYYLGEFNDPDAAHQAYLNAKRRLHAGCTI